MRLFCIKVSEIIKDPFVLVLAYYVAPQFNVKMINKLSEKEVVFTQKFVYDTKPKKLP